MTIDVASLEEAIKECSERRLVAATTWATELLVSLPTTSKPLAPIPFQSHNQSENQGPGPEETDESTLIRIAQAHFDNRQYYRVGHLLKGCKSSRARFLRVYSLYLTAEKKAQNVWNGMDGSRHQTPSTVNTSLEETLDDLEGPGEDSYLLFLRGVVLARMNRRLQAIEELLQSVTIQPWNWSAWKQIGNCLETSKEVSQIRSRLPKHPMSAIFCLTMAVEMYLPTEQDTSSIESLLQSFPESLYLLSLKAQMCFLQKDWITAEQIWEHILKTDPYRVDDIDQYSNMLFIMKKKDKLLKLAQAYMEVDDERPEVQVLIGNYYSMLDDHDRAVKYLRRAIQLNRHFKSAWRLIGHEYVYIKNYHAAIEAYRRAIDISKLDYRTWHGLGRAYEGLGMHAYALNYYQRALSLYSYDPSLWAALASCYKTFNRPRDTITALQRALTGSSLDKPTDMDKTYYLEMAGMYELLGQEYEEDQAECYKKVVAICRKLGKPITDYAKSCICIARFHIALATQSLRQNAATPALLADKTAPNVLIARQYLEMLIADDKSRGTASVDEVTHAKEMLRKLESVKL